MPHLSHSKPQQSNPQLSEKRHCSKTRSGMSILGYSCKAWLQARMLDSERIWSVVSLITLMVLLRVSRRI